MQPKHNIYCSENWGDRFVLILICAPWPSAIDTRIWTMVKMREGTEFLSAFCRKREGVFPASLERRLVSLTVSLECSERARRTNHSVIAISGEGTWSSRDLWWDPQDMLLQRCYGRKVTTLLPDSLLATPPHENFTAALPFLVAHLPPSALFWLPEDSCDWTLIPVDRWVVSEGYQNLWTPQFHINIRVRATPWKEKKKNGKEKDLRHSLWRLT